MHIEPTMTQSSRTRTEADSFGSIDVPGDALWGAQTARSLRFFAIGEQRMPLVIVHALAQVKRAAAEVNADLGLLDPVRAGAIAAAATRIATGELDAQFPLSVWQTGSGTQSHMNVNEVIAHLATGALGSADDGPGAGHRVHPNDDVNLGQSSNDVFPTAMHVAAVEGLMRKLAPALVKLRATLVEVIPAGEKLINQRFFVVQRPAPSADAQGGVRALTAATDAAIVEIEQWLQASSKR